MRIAVFVNSLGVGGTEKAACCWARGLKARGHQVSVLTLQDGPRRDSLADYGVEVRVMEGSALNVANTLRAVAPEVIHAHAPGHPHVGDVLGEALASLRKIPVVQTNVFGHLENPREDRWTDFRLFIAWTTAVQAARRSLQKLDRDFFRRSSVTVYPVEPDEGPDAESVTTFRRAHGIVGGEIVFGHLARPDAIRWDDTPIRAFRRCLRKNRNMKCLLRTPPPEVAETLQRSPEADHFIILPLTADQKEVRMTAAAMDVVLHYSRVGESFGYGIAEPMNFGKPAIVNSTPWESQAQLELARHGECGFVASTAPAIANAMLRLANDSILRQRFGAAAKKHIRTLANPETSITRLEQVLRVAAEGGDNPFAEEDFRRAHETGIYLDAQQFGRSLGEQLALRPFYYRVRFNRWRKMKLARWRNGSA